MPEVFGEGRKVAAKYMRTFGVAPQLVCCLFLGLKSGGGMTCMEGLNCKVLVRRGRLLSCKLDLYKTLDCLIVCFRVRAN